MKPTPDAIDVAIARAPQAIQDYITDGSLAEEVVSISESHSLHVDTIGTLAELSRNMLVGLSSPAELFGELVMSGVDAETAKKVLADLNEKVFVPLAGALRTAPASTAPPAPAVPAPVQPTPRPAASVIPASSPTPRIEQHSVPPAVPQIPAIPPIPAVPAASISSPSVLSVPREHEAMRTMASDMQAAKQHRVPEPIYDRPIAPAISHVAMPPMPPTPPPPAPIEPPHQPAMSASPTAPIAPPSIPPTNPAVPPSMPTPSVTSAPLPTPPVSRNQTVPEPRTAPPPPNLPRIPQQNQYPIDPYREPVE